MKRFILSASMLAACFGCASEESCTGEEDRMDQVRLPSMASSLTELSLREGEGVQVLALSGGGSWSSFCAGVFNAWKSPRPNFNIVTGVSGGALAATSVFLGDAETLKKAFTETSSEDVYSLRFPLFIPFSNSVFSTSPLRKKIARTITNEVIDRVASEGRKGRRLFVGSVDLDSGEMVAWDMTWIAGQRNYDLYRKVVLASAAIPVLFPPVRVGGRMHADGGIRQSIFLHKLMTEVTSRRKLMGWVEPPTVYALVNQRIGVAKQETADAILPVGIRSLEIQMDENLIGNLYRLKSASQEIGFRFRMMQIPEDFPLDFSAIDFNPDKMTSLYQAGLRSGREGVWSEFAPR